MLPDIVASVALPAFVSFLVVIDPIGMVPIFIALTGDGDRAWQRAMARRAVLVAAGVLVFFGLFGAAFLELLGIGLPAFRIAGGAMLFLIAIEMVFEKRTERRRKSATALSASSALPDVAVFPLAVPLIAGPASLTAIMLLLSDATVAARGTVIVVLGVVLVVCYILFCLAGPIGRLMGDSGTQMFSRILGMILAALAVQYILDGLRGFGWN